MTFDEVEDYFAILGNGSSDDGETCSVQRFFIPTVWMVVALIGVILNSVVIFIIVVLKEYQQSISKVYIVQLAVADFLFLFPVFFQGHAMFIGEWTYGVTWCKISEVVKMMNCYSSVWLLTIMSIDRYMAISLAMKFKVQQFRTKKASYIASVCIWCMAFVGAIHIAAYVDVDECECSIYFPDSGDNTEIGMQNINDTFSNFLSEFPAMDLGITDKDYGDRIDNVTAGDEESQGYLDIPEGNLSKLENILKNIDPCSLNEDQVSDVARKWILINFFLVFLVPFTVMLLSCISTLRRLKRPMAVGVRPRSAQIATRRVTRLVIGLVITFFICWLPYHSFQLARLSGVRLRGGACYAVTDFTIALAYSNSSINPVFYVILSTTFRKRLLDAAVLAKKRTQQSFTRPRRERSQNRTGSSLPA